MINLNIVSLSGTTFTINSGSAIRDQIGTYVFAYNISYNYPGLWNSAYSFSVTIDKNNYYPPEFKTPITTEFKVKVGEKLKYTYPSTWDRDGDEVILNTTYMGGNLPAFASASSTELKLQPFLNIQKGTY